ncbi:hypothetical protein PGB90_005945 [Kerria lacca]
MTVLLLLQRPVRLDAPLIADLHRLLLLLLTTAFRFLEDGRIDFKLLSRIGVLSSRDFKLLLTSFFVGKLFAILLLIIMAEDVSLFADPFTHFCIHSLFTPLSEPEVVSLSDSVRFCDVFRTLIGIFDKETALTVCLRAGDKLIEDARLLDDRLFVIIGFFSASDVSEGVVSDAVLSFLLLLLFSM